MGKEYEQSRQQLERIIKQGEELSMNQRFISELEQYQDEDTLKFLKRNTPRVLREINKKLLKNKGRVRKLCEVEKIEHVGWGDESGGGTDYFKETHLETSLSIPGIENRITITFNSNSQKVRPVNFLGWERYVNASPLRLDPLERVFVNHSSVSINDDKDEFIVQLKQEVVDIIISETRAKFR